MCMYIVALIFLCILLVISYRCIREIVGMLNILNSIHDFESHSNCRVIYLTDKKADIKYINMEKIIFGRLVGHNIDNSNRIMGELANASNKTEKIYLIIDSSGGLADSCDDIVKYIKILRQKGCYFIAIIPERARSSACCIAFACNEIQMDETAVVSPTDPRVNYDTDSDTVSYSVASAIKAYNNIENIDPPTMADLAKYYDDVKSFNWNKETMKKNLKHFFVSDQENSTEKFNEVVNLLCDGDIPHHILFSRRDLCDFGLKINKIDKSLDYDIISFFWELDILDSWSY